MNISIPLKSIYGYGYGCSNINGVYSMEIPTLIGILFVISIFYLSFFFTYKIIYEARRLKW